MLVVRLLQFLQLDYAFGNGPADVMLQLSVFFGQRRIHSGTADQPVDSLILMSEMLLHASALVDAAHHPVGLASGLNARELGFRRILAGAE